MGELICSPRGFGAKGRTMSTTLRKDTNGDYFPRLLRARQGAKR